MRDLYINDDLNDVSKNKEMKFVSNFIKTTKYTIFSFLPQSIINQYKRLANWYFLVLTCMGFIPSISPWEPMAMLQPTILVLLISMIREGFEDYTRYKMDKVINSDKVERIRPGTGSLETVKSQDVKVGDILLIREG